MGSACSTNAKVKAQIEKNKASQRKMIAERKKKVLKLLLLGPSESGKSTILKQIRIIHTLGFSDSEKLARKFIIYQNLVSGCVDLVKAMEVQRLAYQIPETFELAQQICIYYEANKNNELIEITSHLGDWIGRLLMDPSVQKALYRVPEISIDDAAIYFMQNLERIREHDYIPTTEDILKSRVPTTGVIQFTFRCNSFLFRLFDVGGQKAQRKKWIHIFNDVNAVLFITSLSEYNQMLLEDSKTNRMRDSIELFNQICNNQWFAETAMILFLNKIDLFEEKIKIFPISIALPRYKGAMEYRPVLDYITKKFRQQNKNPERTIYTHETCATDTRQIQVVTDPLFDRFAPAKGLPCPVCRQ
ncbi:unnamed protein product, partial [Mesorhabditis belari]|uniref:Uncharacterized protein n=1 Tax=Mesorhabditis belari TaxID=2138241 RepID=A0AAF3FQ50_9BILA